MQLWGSRRQGLGCKFEETNKHPTYGIDRLGVQSGNAEVPECLHLMKHVGPVMDQGATNSCVGHAVAAGIHIVESAAGLPFEGVSRRYIYANSRLGHDDDRKLSDTGTFVRTACHGVRALGVPDEKHMPWPGRVKLGTRAINMIPGWTAHRHAHHRAGGQYAKIWGTGESRGRQVRASIASGMPVVFGARVSDAFLAQAGDIYIREPSSTDLIAGNHAMVTLGWKTVDGERWYRVQNSWGTGWRDYGDFWMAESYLLSPHTQDLHIMSGGRRVMELA